MEPEALYTLYPEFDAYQNQCRFDGCLHNAEPDCAVKQAVAQGELDEPRYQRYLQILQQIQEKWRKRYE